jgi:phosphoglycolate phosphatase-like HAD superfamily hydrolase
MRSFLRNISTVTVALLWLTVQAVAQTDPLPSWNATPSKQAILTFVAKVTQEGGPDFVPPEQRVAVFDMDGTLAPEKPVPLALIPVLADIKETVARKSSFGDKSAVAALLKGDHAALHALGEQGINDLIAVATDGKTTEEIVRNVRPLMANSQSEKFGVPYIRTAYRPMRELLALLEANGFKTWICSGSPLLITRELTQEMFGIPPERVMGSSVRTRLDERDGKTVLVFAGHVEHLNDQEGKPVTINRTLGIRPLFVAGNEGGRGDIAMMRWSRDRDGPSFQLLIDHDDAEREFAYAEPDNFSLNAASKYGFQVVSIKRDWKTVVDGR